MFDLLAAPLMYASDLMNLVQTVVPGRILCWGAYCGSDLDVPKGGVVAHIVVAGRKWAWWRILCMAQIVDTLYYEK